MLHVGAFGLLSKALPPQGGWLVGRHLAAWGAPRVARNRHETHIVPSFVTIAKNCKLRKSASFEKIQTPKKHLNRKTVEPTHTMKQFENKKT